VSEPRAARTRLEVWGDPIAHSRSPELHGAAYRVLGLDWEFSRRRVLAGSFDEVLNGPDAGWRGLAVTMPLKEAAWRAAVGRSREADLTGAVNTLFFGDDAGEGPSGFNTDVGGIVRALGELGIDGISRARIVGAGATASSALVSLAAIGAGQVEVVARRPERAAVLAGIGERLGVRVAVRAFDEAADDVELTVATLPGGTELPEGRADRLAETGGALFDVAYHPWPSALARRWPARLAHSGLGMLLHQAVLQVRIFAQGSPEAELPREDEVVAAMRLALMGD
jgi:shikimate dehydrogenase